MTKFSQSVQFNSTYKQYAYDGARQMMKDQGISSGSLMIEYVTNDLSDEQVKTNTGLTKKEFLEVLNIVKRDCLDILLVKNSSLAYPGGRTPNRRG